jgi:hypothetical protein
MLSVATGYVQPTSLTFVIMFLALAMIISVAIPIVVISKNLNNKPIGKQGLL